MRVTQINLCSTATDRERVPWEVEEEEEEEEGEKVGHETLYAKFLIIHM